MCQWCDTDVMLQFTLPASGRLSRLDTKTLDMCTAHVVAKHTLLVVSHRFEHVTGFFFCFFLFHRETSQFSSDYIIFIQYVALCFM